MERNKKSKPENWNQTNEPNDDITTQKKMLIQVNFELCTSYILYRREKTTKKPHMAAKKSWTLLIGIDVDILNYICVLLDTGFSL